MVNWASLSLTLAAVGGTIPNQFMPAVEKGCKELLERGALAGYRIQDVAVEVFFGKDHPVDSSEAAFKTAGRMAFKTAFLQARPVLLEPIVNLEVTVPEAHVGLITGDLSGKRGRIQGQDFLPGGLVDSGFFSPGWARLLCKRSVGEMQ